MYKALKRGGKKEKDVKTCVFIWDVKEQHMVTAMCLKLTRSVVGYGPLLPVQPQIYTV